MDYKSGQPKFSVEKPKKIIWGNEMLQVLQDSERFIGEFKLDEHRGQLCFEANGKINFYSYRGGTYDVDPALKEILRSFNIPEGSVFDGGFLKLKKLGDLPYLYIFDVLVYDGKKVWKKFGERRKFLHSIFHTKDRLCLPPAVTNFIEEFKKLQEGKSELAREMAKSFNIEYKLLEPLIEGFVIKDINGVHGFPQSVKKSNNFYKLRLQDIGRFEEDDE